MQKLSLDGLGRNVLIDDDEQVIWHEKPDKNKYALEHENIPWPFVLFWFGIDLIAVIIMLAEFENLTEVLFTLFAIGLHMFPVWYWLYSIIKALKEMKFLNYCLTNKKVILTTEKTTTKILYSDITDIVFSETKWTRTGDITFKTKNNQTVRFAGIKYPSKKYATIRLIVDNYSK